MHPEIDTIRHCVDIQVNGLKNSISELIDGSVGHSMLKASLRMWLAFKLSYETDNPKLVNDAFKQYKTAAHIYMDDCMENQSIPRCIPNGDKISFMKPNTDAAVKVTMDVAKLYYDFFESMTTEHDDPLSILVTSLDTIRSAHKLMEDAPKVFEVPNVF